MGRTLPSATVVFMQEEAAFARFRRALRRSDQVALDDLFVSARQHLAAAQYASHALPFEVMLLAMLLEEHKEVMKLRERVEMSSATRFAKQIVADTAEGGLPPEGGAARKPPRLVHPGNRPASLPGLSEGDGLQDQEDLND